MSLLGKSYKLDPYAWTAVPTARSKGGKMPTLNFVPGYPGKFVVLGPEGGVLAEVPTDPDRAVAEQQRMLKVLMQGWQALSEGGAKREKVLREAGLEASAPSA